jgi:hypothetical protein
MSSAIGGFPFAGSVHILTGEGRNASRGRTDGAVSPGCDVIRVVL